MSQEEKKRKLEEKTRFAMVKNHHAQTYEKAKNLGRMDEDFILFCDYIEKTKNYFTASSCAGRIALIGLGEEEKKQESAFYRKWHRKVKPVEVTRAVRDFKGTILWFKQEPLILHLGASSLENARKILVFCEKCGIKRAGIKVAKEGKFIIEMTGTQNINAPVKEGKTAADEKYLKYLVKKANEKFDKNRGLIRKMEKEAKKILL